jgi:hypothetical protein
MEHGNTGRRPGDEGATLTELVVAMSIMSVILVIIVGATIQIYRSVNATESTTVARDQLGTGFRRLDKELRYASWVATPGKVGDRWYLEYATSAGCRQLKLDGAVLSTASWDPATVKKPSGQQAIASELALTQGADPFTVHLAGSLPFASASPGTAGVGRNFSPEHDQVRLRFTAETGTAALPFDVVFTAANTSRLTSRLNPCSEGRPTS